MPFWQIPDAILAEASSGATFLVRGAQDPSALVSAATAQVRLLVKDQAVYGVSTMSELIGASLAAEGLAMWLFGLFAMLAVILAAVGTYGVISYAVARRTNEIGIRMALWASRRDVLGLVVRQGTRRALAGVAVGVAAAVALTRLLSGLLYGVSATDPLAFALAAAFLVAVSEVATLVPAHRAVRIDPTWRCAPSKRRSFRGSVGGEDVDPAAVCGVASPPRPIRGGEVGAPIQGPHPIRR